MIDPELRPFLVLGIPVANLSMSECIAEIEKFIGEYAKDKRPRYVATLNSDFVVNAHASESPELLSILRKADLVTLDGMPLLFFGRKLGVEVQERITGVDLIPPLAQAMGEKKQKMFLLGGNERVLNLTKLYLEAENSGLQVVGISDAQIAIEGDALQRAEHQDTALLDAINRVHPDVLLLNLGSPKQEIWFERVRGRLKVPVTIGVGGSFNLLTNTLPRAPLWMQQWGLEWIYRLIQEPQRLGKRYLRDAFKVPQLLMPPTVYHFTKNFLRAEAEQSSTTPWLFLSKQHAFTLIHLPACIGRAEGNEIHSLLDDLLEQEALVLDGKDVKYADLEGLAALFEVFSRAAAKKRPLYLMQPSSNLRKLFLLHKMEDLLAPHLCPQPADVLQRFNFPEDLFISLQQQPHELLVSFFGPLDHSTVNQTYLHQIEPMVQHKQLLLDLQYVTYIDNSGKIFLEKLRKLD